jgi:phosphatidylserine/phosphatidylglycerophosphate/cardiolipin synthase-like enzyme
MPFIVLPKAGLKIARAEALAVMVTPEMVPRNCHLTPPPDLLKNIKAIPCSDQFIAYASPDSTYAVTRKLFDTAKKKILIGIYDFTATYMKELVVNAMNRGVKVSLMLDVDSTDEEKLMKDLAKLGAQTVYAPSCANKQATHFFASSHEKVIVIDDTWCLVQSGNYSNNSIPFNEKDGGDPAHFITGNRDMGVAIKSKTLSAFFTKVLKADIKLEVGIESAQALVLQPELPELFEAVPELLPKQLFPSKAFSPKKPIDVLPILSPDNYMEVIPKLLAAAKTSILIENQYIRSSQPLIAKLLEAIKTAKTNNPKLDVRIILGKLFSQSDVPKEKVNVANMKKLYKLALGTNIRYIDVKRFVHCHNKLIIIDGKTVLASSQNWSDSAVSKNREAGVLMTFPDLAAYYTKIFESDWSTASKTIPVPPKSVAAPETLMTGRFVKVVPADYEEV